MIGYSFYWLLAWYLLPALICLCHPPPNRSTIKIDKKDGNKIFKLNNNQFNDKDIKYIQNYLLNQIEILLTCPNENIKYMLNYIVVGGLSLVIPEIKEQYPDFCFAF